MEFGLCSDLINSFPEIQLEALNFILEIHRCHLSREGENKISTKLTFKIHELTNPLLTNVIISVKYLHIYKCI